MYEGIFRHIMKSYIYETLGIFEIQIYKTLGKSQLMKF